MIIDSKARHTDRHYAILPSPAFFLCELVVANPLNGFTTGKGLDLISNLQFLHQTIARRSRNLSTLQKAAVWCWSWCWCWCWSWCWIYSYLCRCWLSTARPDRNESGFPRHAGGASLTH